MIKIMLYGGRILMRLLYAPHSPHVKKKEMKTPNTSCEVTPAITCRKITHPRISAETLAYDTHLHDGAFVSAVVGDGGVLVEVANTAVVSVRPVPRTTTERAIRDTVSARVVAHAPPNAVAVSVRAVVFVAAVQGRRNIADRTEVFEVCKNTRHTVESKIGFKIKRKIAVRIQRNQAVENCALYRRWVEAHKLFSVL